MPHFAWFTENPHGLESLYLLGGLSNLHVIHIYYINWNEQKLEKSNPVMSNIKVIFL